MSFFSLSMMLRNLPLSLVLLSYAPGSLQAEAPRGHQSWAKGSIVNTNFNTWWKDGRWESDMGPLTTFEGGLACDHRAREQGNPRKYREGDYAVWFVAPSDLLDQLGLKRCGPNAHGGEPSCYENWDFCGRKLRLSCKEGHPGCAGPGSPSLLAEMNRGRVPVNNYIPEIYRQKTQERVGHQPSTPRSIVLYITDFCPQNHSMNIPTGHCQGPQVDVSASAFLLFGKQNAQGYIDGNLEYQVELLDEHDPTPAGPEWGASPRYPYCRANGGQGYGDRWESEGYILAKDQPDYSDRSICTVRAK
jgi:hypothetical protein